MVKLLVINLENSGKNSTFLLLGKVSVHYIYMHLQGKLPKMCLLSFVICVVFVQSCNTLKYSWNVKLSWKEEFCHFSKKSWKIDISRKFMESFRADTKLMPIYIYLAIVLCK